MTPREGKIELARREKADKIAKVLREAMAESGGTLTVQDCRTRDTENFWRIVVERAGVRPPSKPAAVGMYHWISPPTRDLVLKLLAEATDGKR